MKIFSFGANNVFATLPWCVHGLQADTLIAIRDQTRYDTSMSHDSQCDFARILEETEFGQFNDEFVFVDTRILKDARKGATFHVGTHPRVMRGLMESSNFCRFFKDMRRELKGPSVWRSQSEVVCTWASIAGQGVTGRLRARNWCTSSCEAHISRMDMSEQGWVWHSRRCGPCETCRGNHMHGEGERALEIQPKRASRGLDCKIHSELHLVSCAF